MKLPSMLRLGRLKVFLNSTWFTQHTHGPKSWRWWQLLVVHPAKVRLNGELSPLRLNHNVWFYTRWGAWCCQVVYDTRTFE